MIRSVGDRRPREVERRREHLDDLIDLRRAGGLQLRLAEDVDRHRCVGHRALGGARTDDRDFTEVDDRAAKREVLRRRAPAVTLTVAAMAP